MSNPVRHPLGQIWSQQQAADFLGVDVRTIRNMISRGDLTAYRIRGSRAVRLNAAEVRAALEMIPTVIARQQPFGPKARIVDLRNVVSPIPGAEK